MQESAKEYRGANSQNNFYAQTRTQSEYVRINRDIVQNEYTERRDQRHCGYGTSSR